jgi:hypothetical protein
MISYKKLSCRSGMFISDPGFWIQDPTTTKKRGEWGGGEIGCLAFSVTIIIAILKTTFLEEV